MDILPFVEQLRAVPEFANLGNLFKSSNMPVELTESETEYVVQCVKHTFGRYMVFQVFRFFIMQCNSCICICEISIG